MSSTMIPIHDSMRPVHIRNPKIRVIAALDFGSSYSGFASAHVSDIKDQNLSTSEATIEGFYSWDDQLAPYSKTATSILYSREKSTGSSVSSILSALRLSDEQKNADFNIESWGFTALKEYLDFCSSNPLDEEILSKFAAKDQTPTTKSEDGSESVKKTKKSGASSEDFMFLDRFKLYLDNDIAKELRPLPNGLTAERVISDYLGCMHKLFVDLLQKKYGSTIQSENISWFLTIPALWSDHAKQVMRKAAVTAGLVPPEAENDSTRLSLILEPEAAALFCCSKSEQFQLKNEDYFTIVDCGGGTVDLQTHQLLRDEVSGRESLSEICHGTGSSCGATFVDDNFLKFLRSKVGDDAIDALRSEEPHAFLQVMRTWEEFKRSFAGLESFKNKRSNTDNPVKPFSIPVALYNLISEAKSLQLEQEPFGFYGDIWISLNDMLQIFDPVIERVLDLIETQLHRAEEHIARTESSPTRKIDKLFLVGGFSASPYLFNRVQERFQDRVGGIYRPQNPGSAVVQGAVLSGLKPRFIQARCCRLTYGVRVSSKWREENPKGPSVKYYNRTHKCDYANNHFTTMVRRGQQVTVDECFTTHLYPSEADQKTMSIKIYATDRLNEKYIQDDMEMLGEIVVSMPDISKGIDREITMRLYFGLSEITAVAINSDTREQKTTTIKFYGPKSTTTSF